MPVAKDTKNYSQVVRSVLTPQEFGKDLYRSTNLWKPYGTRGIFGGHIVSQALMAAYQTVASEFGLNSLHSYFVLPAKKDIPTEYYVTRERDGRTFATRTVHTKQNGATIFVIICSFQREEMSHISHQTKMPDTPTPDEVLESTTDSAKKFHSSRILGDSDLPIPIVNRTIHIDHDPENPIASRLSWVRVNCDLDGLEPLYHQAMTVFLSDFLLAKTGLFPYITSLKGNTSTSLTESDKESPEAQFEFQFMVSLDHSVWFHNIRDVSKWMLYEMETTWGDNGRVLCHGRLYSSIDGSLIASTSQEALCRYRPKAGANVTFKNQDGTSVFPPALFERPAPKYCGKLSPVPNANIIQTSKL
ncbi:acyl-CoA thioesterase [Mycoemilia scoparia]|uniref:Acyl-CoA thioesterase n=1 Tax=Mycoemilia scoparia TaxID=417184 RepID=A0A9W8DLG5_9FUNG|nr:acyl-CoA thioesterase [Mycoemilia scoparia]